MASQKDYIDELKSQIEFLQLECDILNSQHKHKEKHKKKHKDKHNEGSRGRSGAQIPSDASLQRPVLLNKENAGSNESRPHTQSTSQQLKGKCPLRCFLFPPLLNRFYSNQVRYVNILKV